MLKKDIKYIEYLIELNDIFSKGFSKDIKIMKKEMNKKQYKYFVKNYKYNFDNKKFEKRLDK